jgi:adenosylhomocysteine nucleosidase
MNVLVTYAVDAEFAPWRKLRNLTTREVRGVHVHQASIGRAVVDFVVTGPGMENAKGAAEAVLGREHKACLACGFAGSLRPALGIGDVFAPRAVRQLGKAKTLECSRNLFMAAAYENGAKEAGMLLTADHVVETAEEKQRLRPFADAVDMESFGILAVAREKGVAAAAVRVISDRFDEDLPTEIDTAVDERGQVKIGGVVKYVTTHPLNLPALIRLGRASHTAAEALAHFLEAFIKELSFRTHGWPPPDLQEVASR